MSKDRRAEIDPQRLQAVIQHREGTGHNVNVPIPIRLGETGIGLAVVFVCPVCGMEINITDYTNW